ncbi:OmpA family protein [Oceanivirga miroungae]|uniref:Surface protein/Bartonella adhesin BadA n=1 Tax=Oceanivirga miroungae TaxID=1130046 RepID=A0A6I8MDP3_9FUSO|nr:OmpA family protein [Oceanivirga miroungae]VWL85211.1 Surface protein/Bartonella adhesin BadA [Oceanivirga miroungae]
MKQKNFLFYFIAILFAVQQIGYSKNLENKATGISALLINGEDIENTEKEFKSEATGAGSVAVGSYNKATAKNASALGYFNKATAKSSSAVGSVNTVAKKFSTAVGAFNIVEGIKSQTVGYLNYSSGYGSIVYGNQNNREFKKNYGINGEIKTGDFSMAFGIGNNNAGEDSLTLGHGNYAMGFKSLAIGYSSISEGQGSTVIGERAYILEDTNDAIAFGNYSKTAVNDGVAIGSYSLAETDKNTYGYNPKLGRVMNDSDLSQKGEYEKKYKAEKNAKNDSDKAAIAAEKKLLEYKTEKWTTKEEGEKIIGEYVKLNNEALEKIKIWKKDRKELSDVSGPWKSTAGAFSVGNSELGIIRQITGVSAGTKLTDAVNLAQLKAWSPTFYNNGRASNGNLSGDEITGLDDFGKLGIYFGEGLKAENVGKGLLISLDENSGRISKKNIDDSVKKLSSGIASSYAIATIPQVTYDRLFSIGAGTGLYNGKGAFAIGISGQNRDRNFVYKASVSIGEKANIGIAAGINLSLGKIKKEETKVVEVVKENPINNKLIERIEALEKEVLKLKEKESISYTIDNFVLDSDKITGEQTVKLKEIVEVVNSKFTNKTIVIIGYTDIRHNEEYNLDLGMRRAREAKKALIELGLSNDVNIILKSYGYNERVEGDYGKQRRVEILINDINSYR